MLGFSHTRRPWLAAIMLSAIALRALIPAGFMPGAGGLEFCSGGMPSMAAMAGMAGHHHHHAAPGAPASSSHGGEGCVFAGSAAGLAPPCLPVVLVPQQAPALHPIPSTAIEWVPTILRAQSSRGPPAYS